MDNQERNYIAFISYRHKPLDMTVAEELIKLIEHYRVPKDLRQDDNTSLGMVFRDRDELGVHHDLEDAIYPALDHSAFLIVVCTPDTQDSPWIKLEIQRFLQTHPRDRILVVHAAGTAEEAVPQEITHVYDEQGNLVGVETPLSIYLVDSNQQKVLSNLRKEFLRIAAVLMRAPYEDLTRQQEYQKPRKHLKKEFLRLVAALLGCPYDALVQRNKRYLYQRLMIFSLVVATFLLVFALVVISKNQQISALNLQIQEQLLQTQLRESETLTLLSQQQLKEGDRMSAIRSALNALPREAGERPYYPEAANALAEALQLYTPNGTMVSHSLMDVPIGITGMAVSNNGEYAAILNEADILQYYHIPSGSIIWENYHNENPLTAEEEVELSYLPAVDKIDFLFLMISNDGQRIIHATPTATCVLSAATGEHLYTLEYPRTLSVTLSENDRYLAICGQDDTVVFYDFKTGEKLSQTNALPYDGAPFRRVEKACFSQSEDTFLAIGYDADSKFDISDSKMHLFLINPQTGALIRHESIDPENYSGDGLCVTMMPDGGFAVFCHVTGGESRGTYCILLDSGGNYRTVTREEDVDPVCWTALWNEYLVSAAEKEIYVYNSTDGSLAAMDAFSSAIVQCCFDKQGDLLLFLKDGTVCRLSLESDDGIYVKELDQFEYGKMLSGAYVPRQGAAICCLMPSIYTANPAAAFIGQINRSDTEELGWNQYNSTVTVSPSGNYFEIGYDGVTVDSTTREVTMNPLPTAVSMHSLVSGFAADENKKIYSNGIVYDIVSGETEKIELWNDLPELTPDYLTTVSNSGDDVVFNEVSRGWQRILYQEPGQPLLSAVYHEGRIHWWQDDMHDSGSLCPFADRMGLIPETTNVIVGKNGLMLLRIPTEQTWSIDHQTGSSETAAYVIYSISEDCWYWLDYPVLPEAVFGYIPTASEKWIAFMDGTKRVYLYDPAAGEMASQFEVPFSAESVETVHFMRNDTIMFVSLSNDICYLIDTKTGSILGDPIPGYYDTIQFDVRKNFLFLSGNYHGAIVDLENNYLIKYVLSMRGYLSASDKIICYDETTRKYLLYPVYSVEQMVGIGLEMTGQQ